MGCEFPTECPKAGYCLFAEKRKIATVNIITPLRTDTNDDAHIPGFLIFRAMVESLQSEKNPDASITSKFSPSGHEVKVELRVNDIPVDVIATLKTTWKNMDSHIEERARKIALRMVTEAGLDPLREALQSAERNIREVLKTWDNA